MTEPRTTPHGAQRLRNQSGYTLVELMVTLAIFAVLARATLPHIDTRVQDVNTATNQVVSDFRWARARAISSGVHYIVQWQNSTSYQVQRLKLDASSNWVLDRVVRTVTLPNNVAVVESPLPAAQEFNTRGMIVNGTAVVYQTLKDSRTTGKHKIGVWPSGQVYVES
jgi:prepilin-type N-terminal cleavage/methylation domain-containing protein